MSLGRAACVHYWLVTARVVWRLMSRRMIAHRISWTAKRNSLRNAKLVQSQWTLFVSFVAKSIHNFTVIHQKVHRTEFLFRFRCDSFYIHRSEIQCFELALKYEPALPGITVLTSWSAFMCAQNRDTIHTDVGCEHVVSIDLTTEW